MNNLLFYLLVLPVTVQYTTGAGTNSTHLDFVKTSCKTTPYPALCVNSLSNYAASINGNNLQLAKAAITVILNNAMPAAADISKLAGKISKNSREYQALKDCENSMTSYVASLTQSVQELGKMGQYKDQTFVWHMNYVRTWVLSALKHENTCARGFFGSTKIMKTILNRSMIYISQLTSNALALVNVSAERHKEVTNNP